MIQHITGNLLEADVEALGEHKRKNFSAENIEIA